MGRNLVGFSDLVKVFVEDIVLDDLLLVQEDVVLAEEALVGIALHLVFRLVEQVAFLGDVEQEFAAHVWILLEHLEEVGLGVGVSHLELRRLRD